MLWVHDIIILLVGRLFKLLYKECKQDNEFLIYLMLMNCKT